MKFSCETYLLKSAVATAARAAAAKSSIPALEGLLIEAGDEVKITGYDLKKGIYTSIPADISQPGSVVLGARLLDEILRSLPESVVTLSSDDANSTSITCESSDFLIMGSSSEDYPDLPDLNHQLSFSVNSGIIKKMINQTVFAVSDNESKPVYTGSLFEVNGDSLIIVAVDGYRLAMRKEKLENNDISDCSFIVPGSTLVELEKICSDSDKEVKIRVGTRQISFAIEKTVLISRRIEGEFLNYKKAVPTSFSIQVTAEKSPLTRVIDRVSLIIDDKVKNPLRCTFDDGEIKLFCLTPRGKAEDFCPVEGSGNGLEIGFNNRYLLDALKVAPAEKLRICLNNASSPCVMIPVDGSDAFLYMILPVRLKAGE